MNNKLMNKEIMNKGIIYFLQPSELVGTNRYKIGCSRSLDLRRCNNGYRKGSIYICIMQCVNPFILEKNIKKEFKKEFKLISGTEYFEGNEKIMVKKFKEIINEYEKTNDFDINDDNSDNDVNDNLDDEISIIQSCVIPNKNIMKIKKFTCNICRRHFKTYKTRWEHIKKFHSIPNDVIQPNNNNNICKYCNKQLADRKSRWKHEQKCIQRLEIIKNKELQTINNQTINQNITINDNRKSVNIYI